MEIRKKYSINSSHRVLNSLTKRCSNSIHGHQAEIEIFLESKGLDKAMMVYDFGAFTQIKNFLFLMNDSVLMWNKDSIEYLDFIKMFNARWIEFNFSPTAEMLSYYIFNFVTKILSKTKFTNNECEINVSKVIYHETRSGKAICDLGSVYHLEKYLKTENINRLSSSFSVELKKEISSKNLQLFI